MTRPRRPAAGAGPRTTYAGAGVDIAAAGAAIEAIKSRAAETAGPEVLGGLGGFAGLFALDGQDTVLAASADGVGTKAMVARATGTLDTLGVDLVAMCVDDLVCCGARPLFLLDYVSFERLDSACLGALVSGIVEGCKTAGCALLGGETAEHPGAMEPGSFDLAGFAVGVARRDQLIGASKVSAGDALVGLVSPGLRCNGYSLARKVLLETGGRNLGSAAFEGSASTLGDELSRPSVIYTPAVLSLRDHVELHAAAHVTGGGLPGNVSRILRPDRDAVLDRSTWQVPPIFAEIQLLGGIDDEEMERVFNLGIGMVLAVPAGEAATALAVLTGDGYGAVQVGEVVEGRGRALLVG